MGWIPWQSAVILESRSMIAWHAGEHFFTFRGGLNRASGRQSRATVSSIVAVRGRTREGSAGKATPPLSNRELFRRDEHLCLYCGREYPEHMLTRDHVQPLSLGGRDCWSNVVSACKPCNHAKGARRPEEARMPLLAVPYVPNRAEYLVLSNRRILIDQMAFLKKRFSKRSRLGKGSVLTTEPQ